MHKVEPCRDPFLAVPPQITAFPRTFGHNFQMGIKRDMVNTVAFAKEIQRLIHGISCVKAIPSITTT